MTRPVKTNHVQEKVNAILILSRENRSDLGIDYYYHYYQECEGVAATLKLGLHSMLIYTHTQKLNHHWNKRTRERERKCGKVTQREREINGVPSFWGFQIQRENCRVVVLMADSKGEGREGY